MHHSSAHLLPVLRLPILSPNKLTLLNKLTHSNQATLGKLLRPILLPLPNLQLEEEEEEVSPNPPCSDRLEIPVHQLLPPLSELVREVLLPLELKVDDQPRVHWETEV